MSEQFGDGLAAAKAKGRIGARARGLQQLNLRCDARFAFSWWPGSADMLWAHAQDDVFALPRGQVCAASGRQGKLSSIRKCKTTARYLGRHEVHGWRTEKSRNVLRCRALVEIQRRTLLLDLAVTQQHDTVGHGHGFDLIVGDVDHGLTQLLMKAFDFAAHLVAQLSIQVRQRFIE